MANGYSKIRTLKKEEVVRSTSVNGFACLGHPTGKRVDVLESHAFRAMLALERRRAQRSREPFILLLLNASKLNKDQKGTDFAEHLCGIVSSAIRESDIIGWYQQGEVLGVIYTEIGLNGNCSVAEVVSSKIVRALEENLERAQASKMVVTVHLFPENCDKDRPNRSIDSKLYPDISGDLPRQKTSIILKRGIDIAGSLILLLILSPLLAAIAIAIKLTSRGPVLFRQERMGQLGKNFQCLKFRTMFTDNDSKIHREYVQNFIAGRSAEQNGGEVETEVFKIKDDPRITPLGRCLRRTSLDELPQFWNVLRSEMSLVGPRPPLPYEFEVYDLWHRRRVLEVKPGVTGLWQVMGRSRTSFDEMVRMDLRYSQRWSLWLDFKILLATPGAVLKGSGAY